MEITFKERFIALMNETRKYYRIVEKLEDIFDTTLEKFCEYPQSILDLLEKESNRVWTDEIYDMIYNEDKFDVLKLYDKVMELPLQEDNSSIDKVNWRIVYE